MQTQIFNRFPNNSMMTLTSDRVRYDLAESVGPDLQLSDVLNKADMAELSSLSLEYGTAHGDTALRELIASEHNVTADDVITTVGGMHALFLCSAILCNENDHVLVQQPAFPLTQSALAFGKASVEYLPCRFDDGYSVNINELVARLKPDTSLVCLASPQNPSGVTISRDSIREILDALTRYSPRAFLLLDETYRQASYGNSAELISPVSSDSRIISCASLSKCHGAPGLRTGWAITRHKELQQQLINGKFQTIIACSVLDEAIALRVLQRSEDLFTTRRSHLLEGRNRVSDWVAQHADQLSWVQPDAGALCCVRLNPDQFDAAKIGGFHDELNRNSIRVAPGSWFGDEQTVFRLGFGLLPIPELANGLGVISHALKSLR